MTMTGPSSAPMGELEYGSTFIERELAQKGCTGFFALGHLNADGGPSVLLERAIDPRLKDGEKRKRILEVAEEFNDAAMHAITTHSLPQTYAIVLLAKDHKTPRAQHPFRLAPPTSNALGVLTEAPNAAGAQSQAMRFNEVVMKVGVEKGDRNCDLLFDMVKEARDRIKTVEQQLDESFAKRIACVQAMEDMASQKLQREILLERHKAHLKHVEGLWQNVDGVFRLLLKRNGVELPEGASATGAAPLEKLQKVFKSLTKEQQAQLANILTEEQIGDLADALKGFGFGFGVAA